MALLRLVGDTVASQRLILIDEGEVLGIQPHRDRRATETPLGVDAPPSEARVASPVQHPTEAGGVEDAVQLLGSDELAAHPVQDGGRTPSILWSLLMGEVVLVVVVGDPQVVDGQELRPGSGVRNPQSAIRRCTPNSAST